MHMVEYSTIYRLYTSNNLFFAYLFLAIERTSLEDIISSTWLIVIGTLSSICLSLRFVLSGIMEFVDKFPLEQINFQ